MLQVCLSSGFALLVTKLVACRRRLASSSSFVPRHASRDNDDDDARHAADERGACAPRSFELHCATSAGLGGRAAGGVGAPERSADAVPHAALAHAAARAQMKHQVPRACAPSDDSDDDELYALYATRLDAPTPTPGERGGRGAWPQSPSPPPPMPVSPSVLAAARAPTPLWGGYLRGGHVRGAAAAFGSCGGAGSRGGLGGGIGGGGIGGSGMGGGGFVFAFPEEERPPKLRANAGARLSASAAPLLVEWLMLVEGATAWVTGCAWTDALVAWTSLGAYPTAAVAMQDVGVSALLTLVGMGWLALSGRQPDAISDEAKGSREEARDTTADTAADTTTDTAADTTAAAPTDRPPQQHSRRCAHARGKARGVRRCPRLLPQRTPLVGLTRRRVLPCVLGVGGRLQVELFFATNALTFVVGWSWIVLSRDLTVLSAAGLTHAVGGSAWGVRAMLAAGFALLYGPAVGVAISCLSTDRPT
jgi:hypothetical protein